MQVVQERNFNSISLLKAHMWTDSGMWQAVDFVAYAHKKSCLRNEMHVKLFKHINFCENTSPKFAAQCNRNSWNTGRSHPGHNLKNWLNMRQCIVRQSAIRIKKVRACGYTWHTMHMPTFALNVAMWIHFMLYSSFCMLRSLAMDFVSDEHTLAKTE